MSDEPNRDTFLFPFRMWSSGRWVFQISKASSSQATPSASDPSKYVAYLQSNQPIRSLHSSGVQTIHLGEEFPGEVDSVLLEVVTEGPVTEHLEEGVVVHVLTHIVQIVVLTTGANALLGVASSLQLSERTGGVHLQITPVDKNYLSEENRLVLVHSSVREEKGGVVQGDNRRGLHKGVLMLLKILNKSTTDLRRRPLHRTIVRHRSIERFWKTPANCKTAFRSKRANGINRNVFRLFMDRFIAWKLTREEYNGVRWRREARKVGMKSFQILSPDSSILSIPYR